MTRNNKWARRVAAVLVPAAMLTGLLVQSAHAVTLVTGEGVLSAFTSGDVGRWKADGQRDPANLKWRTVINVWCDNSAGGAVDCDLIEGTNVYTFLSKQVPGSGITVHSKQDYSDAANVHIKPFTDDWVCGGTQLGHYGAFGQDLQVTSRFHEVGTAKDRDSGFTSLSYGSCA